MSEVDAEEDHHPDRTTISHLHHLDKQWQFLLGSDTTEHREHSDTAIVPVRGDVELNINIQIQRLGQSIFSKNADKTIIDHNMRMCAPINDAHAGGLSYITKITHVQLHIIAT